MSDTTYQITKSELRALLFWAATGMSKYKGGSHSNIESIIDKFRLKIKMQPAELNNHLHFKE